LIGRFHLAEVTPSPDPVASNPAHDAAAIADAALSPAPDGGAAGAIAAVVEAGTEKPRVDAAAPMSAHCPSTALLCDSFDGVVAGHFEVLGAATIGYSTETMVRGSAALVSEVSPYSGARVRLPIAPRDSGEVHLRVYLRVEEGPPITEFLALFGLHHDAYKKLAVDVRGQDTAVIVGPQIWASADAVVPRGRWSCWQFSSGLSRQATGWIRLKIDGKTVAFADSVITVTGEPFSELWVGVEWLISESGPIRVYTDELAYGNLEQPCDVALPQ
jgi:hypothetical protein